MTKIQYPKRLVEVDLPIKQLSIHAKREKDMRRGHVPLMHIWPATRPAAACRALICAALWYDPNDPNCPSSFKEKVKILLKEWANTNLNKVSEYSYSLFVKASKSTNYFDDDLVLRNALLLLYL